MADLSYDDLRRRLLDLQAEFESASKSGMRCYHELLQYDPTMLRLWAAQPATPQVAWSWFIERHQRPSSKESWEEWEPVPDGSACSRFHGSSKSESVQEFKRLADRGSALLQALKRQTGTEADFPVGTKVELPETAARLGSGRVCWIALLYEAGRNWPTSVLRVGPRQLWGEFGSPNEPARTAGASRLFLSSQPRLSERNANTLPVHRG